MAMRQVPCGERMKLKVTCDCGLTMEVVIDGFASYLFCALTDAMDKHRQEDHGIGA